MNQKVTADNSLTLFASYAQRSLDQIYSQLQTDPAKGLTQEQVTQLQQRYGLNEIKARETRWYHILLRQFKSPFIYLLFGAALVSFFLQTRFEAAVILAVVLLNAFFGFLQEYRAYRVAAYLNNFIQVTAKVIRHGQQQEVATNTLVPGDIVLVFPGDIIPADIRFISTTGLQVDESTLTGESVAVAKQSAALTDAITQEHQALNIGFAGTTVTGGSGVGVVFATGLHSSLGVIAQLTSGTVRESGFEKNIAQFSNFILKLIGVSLVLVFVTNLIFKPSLGIIDLILFSCALAITVIPEALPIVITFALSHGAVVLARQKVVVKRLSAIEDLGDIELLCVDKTGTLTENQLQVDSVFSSDPQKTIVYANLVVAGTHKKVEFERALDAALKPEQRAELAAYTQIYEIPFDHDRLRNIAVVKKGQEYIMIVRGVTEKILPNCTSGANLADGSAQKWNVQQSAQGKRVITVAIKNLAADQVGDGKDIDKLEHGLTFVGMIACLDPLKKTASQAIAQAAQLHVTIKVLSGDDPLVCGVVAKQVGLIKDAAQVMTGQQFMELSESQKIDAVEQYQVFARVAPATKYEIVTLLQKKYKVGYMGDGINDAPALKVAHVSLAVNDAADIARQAADIILLKKSLLVIINGIQEGRKVFANTLKYMRTTFSATFGNFYSLTLASMVLPFLPMLPVQLLLTNILTDLPMLSIATDNVHVQDLKRPSKYNFKDIVILAVILGVVTTLFDFIFFAAVYGSPAAIVQTGWFIESVLTELAFIFSIRTQHIFYKGSRPSWLLLTLALTIGLLTVCMPYFEVTRMLFGFVNLPVHYLLIIIAVVSGYFIATDLVKVAYYKRYNNKN